MSPPLAKPNKAASIRHSVALRSGLLFLNFFLILLAYYLIKPASRSIFLEHLDSEHLPYVWIASAALMAVLILPYRALVARHSRLHVVVGSCALYIVFLIWFWQWSEIAPGPKLAASLYIFGDIFSVVLLEQFWSLTNSTYRTQEGKKWYGLVGSGALLGGLVGGGFSAWLVGFDRFETGDLLYIAALIIWVIMMMTIVLVRHGVYREKEATAEVKRRGEEFDGWKVIFNSPYLLMMTAILLLSQFAQPIVDYQFLSYVEINYVEEDSRTAFISWVNSMLGGVALAVNLILTPLIHRMFGAVGGLYVQPALLSIAVFIFIQVPGLPWAVVMKLIDRGLSYSINRASKELLYVPVRADIIYRAKAWIDMVGYRVFKILGAGVVILFTSEHVAGFEARHLGWVVLAICFVWALVLGKLRVIYNRLVKHEGGDVGMKKLSPEESV